ncbi:hypothetical protein [Tunturiibacter gelidiferens]|uniref:hypothetical protein n=1 Tax=Tunturiibacter gelidiferens TaxID=3069689 RepID=UPI003D9B15AC
MKARTFTWLLPAGTTHRARLSQKNLSGGNSVSYTMPMPAGSRCSILLRLTLTLPVGTSLVGEEQSAEQSDPPQLVKTNLANGIDRIAGREPGSQIEYVRLALAGFSAPRWRRLFRAFTRPRANRPMHPAPKRQILFRTLRKLSGATGLAVGYGRLEIADVADK